LNQLPVGVGNQKTWTFSGWVKKAVNSGNSQLMSSIIDASNYAMFGFASNSFITGSDYLQMWVTSGGTSIVQLQSAGTYRDPAAWYHVVIAIDTTQATASNRVKLYLNGAQITSFQSGSVYPSLNANIPFLNTSSYYQRIAATGTYGYLDGYLSEVNFIDGQALTPSSFGSFSSTTGVWQPIKYSGTYGTNGFYLPFTNTTSTTTLGYDSSGNGNNWTTNNISLTAGTTYDSMTDVPTLTSATVANYAVLNPLARSTFAASSSNPGNGNLVIYQATTSAWAEIIGTIGVSSGKYYWEVTCANLIVGTSSLLIGICTPAEANAIAQSSNIFVGSTATSWGYFSDNGNKYNSASGVAYGSSYANNDVIGVALDMNAGTVTFYKNNVSQGVAYSGLTGVILPAISSLSGVGYCNFGQQPFTYTPPSGFVALNAYNLPTGTILQGNKVMDATLYTGTGAARSVTNAAGFKPDLVWQKSRSNAYNHGLNDSVRGAGKFLYPNLTDAEGNYPTDFASFDSNGFSLGSGTGNVTNANGATYVAWQWQAGQGSTSSNTNGSITSTVSVNATAGFSVVTYTTTGAAATIGHGLGVAPQFIITKNRNAAASWLTYASALGTPDKYLALESTAAVGTNTTVWNNTAPTSSVFSFGTVFAAGNYVAYCWTPIAGFSAFGSYTGNGSTDNSFIYCGFRPKFILFKQSDGTSDWTLIDTARDPYNVAFHRLYPNSSIAEETSANILDSVSNGFKIRAAYSGTYIYAAFAENPFKYALAR
jgi:hypothetical protein